MNKTWKPTAAGILDIIGGTIQLLIFVSVLAPTVSGCVSHRIYGDAVGWALTLLVITVPLVVAGIIAIVGGVNALRRQKLGLAYMGSVAAFLPLVLSLWAYSTIFDLGREWVLSALLIILFLGIAPIVLTALSRKEFK